MYNFMSFYMYTYNLILSFYSYKCNYKIPEIILIYRMLYCSITRAQIGMGCVDLIKL